MVGWSTNLTIMKSHDSNVTPTNSNLTISGSNVIEHHFDVTSSHHEDISNSACPQLNTTQTEQSISTNVTDEVPTNVKTIDNLYYLNREVR